ncbi:enolase family protein [Histomonas meleagridis]|uniref:enolase family protein n=1 Tax=Histomonas meleagridis TaxID=135588 RepID=UPI003559515E|nr:enolase family protein [Histomonas meleagridis]KAH0802308.1 enolase family protein [Histomonas meleagridis]
MEIDETQLAAEYAEKWDIQTVFEDALTNLLISHPDDPMSFLHNQIAEHSAPPTISKVVGREVLNGIGNPTLEVEIWGQVFGKTKLLGSAQAPSCDFCDPSDAFVVNDINSNRYNGLGAQTAIAIISKNLQPKLEKRPIYDQQMIDSVIESSDGTPNFHKIGVNTSIAISSAIAISSSQLLKVPLFNHLTNTLTHKYPIFVPTPIFTFFEISDSPISKVFLIPNPNKTIEEQIRIICEINLHYSKTSHSVNTNNGTYLIESPTAEDTISFVESVVSASGHSLGDDLTIGFRGSNTSNTKFWIDLLGKQTQIISYIEDPIPFDDIDGWKQIFDVVDNETVSLVMKSGIFSRVERIESDLIGNSIVITPIEAATITKVTKVAQQIEKCNKKIVLATSEVETPDTWICDLAVAVGASMIQIGSILKGENIEKVNRLLEIGKEIIEMEHKQNIT